MNINKVNIMSLASQGMNGDTEIRKIDGKLAHVNKYEAVLIDSKGKLGERIVKAIGSGTINPRTGLRQYDWRWSDPLNFHHQTYNPMDQLLGSGTTDEITGALGVAEEGQQGLFTKMYGQAGGATGQLDFSQLSEYAGSDDPFLNLGGYMRSEFGVGEEYQKYITPFQQERFGFMERGFGLEQEGLKNQLGAATTAFGQGTENLRTSGAMGLGQASGQARSAAGRSRMASVGGITQGFEQQKKGLFQDYTAGMKGLGETRRQAGEAYGLGMQQAQLGYETDVYGEQERQVERFYDELRDVIQIQQAAG